MSCTLHDQIRACKNCPLYKDMPLGNYPVPGKGPLNAKLMLVGEALGADEAILEEPFVGQCGKFLDKILVKVGLARKDIYVCNTVNCRPTKNNGKANRPPTDKEIDACEDWLYKQIKLVKPKVIVTLGKVPTYTLLKSSLKKSFKLSDTFNTVYKHGIPVMKTEKEYEIMFGIVIPNYHPSYVLVHGKSEVDVFEQRLKLAKEKAYGR